MKATFDTVFFCMIVSVGFGQRDIIQVPIGVLYDKDTTKEIKDAFSFELEHVNSRQTYLRLQSEDKTIDMQNAVELIRSTCDLLQKGIFVLFGTHRIYTIETIKSYMKEFRMPFVTPSMAVNLPEQERGYEIYLRPLYSKALLGAIKHYRWERIIYVFQAEEALHRLQQLFDEITRDGLRVRTEMLQVKGADEAYNILKARASKEKDVLVRIVLDLDKANTEKFFAKQKTDAWRTKVHYLLADLNILELDLSHYKQGGINITGFSITHPKNDDELASKSIQFFNKFKTANSSDQQKKIGYEAALTMDGLTLIEKAVARLSLDHGNLSKGPTIDCEASPLTSWKYGYDILAQMRGIQFTGGLTGKVAFDKYGLRKDYKLYANEITRDQGLSFMEWSELEGIKVESRQKQNPKPPKGSNPISNITRIITTIKTDPYLMIKDDKTLVGNDRYYGFVPDLAELIAKKVNFKYEIRPVADEKYGSVDENGTWNGMIGEVLRNEAHLCIAPLTITSQREQVVDFSKPFMSLGITILIKKPDKAKPGVFSFLYPLSPEIWMCVVFAYVGVSVVLFLVSRFSPFEWHIEDTTEGPTVSNNFTIFNSLWFALAAFMQQGCDIEPRSLSGRIVGSVWWFFTLIIISSYTANLAAFLTVERMQSPIESADDLAKQTEIKYGSVGSGSTQEFFKTASTPVYERMWNFMSTQEPSVFVSGNEEGVTRVRNEKYAFLAESTTIEYYTQQWPCDTMKVGNNLDNKGYGIATPLGSDLRDPINLAVLQLRESDVLSQLKTKWWYDKGQCGGQENTKAGGDTANSLRLSHVAGLFYIIASGLVIGLVSALIEFIYKSQVEAIRKKTTFFHALRAKAKLSVQGKPEEPHHQITTTTSYSYAPASQLVSLDPYPEMNTHTQV